MPSEPSARVCWRCLSEVWDRSNDSDGDCAGRSASTAGPSESSPGAASEQRRTTAAAEHNAPASEAAAAIISRPRGHQPSQALLSSGERGPLQLCGLLRVRQLSPPEVRGAVPRRRAESRRRAEPLRGGVPLRTAAPRGRAASCSSWCTRNRLAARSSAVSLGSGWHGSVWHTGPSSLSSVRVRSHIGACGCPTLVVHVCGSKAQLFLCFGSHATRGNYWARRLSFSPM